MSSQKDRAWFQLLPGEAGPFLHYNGRLRQLIEELSSPWTQFPSMAMFMGRKRKDVALKQLFPENALTSGPEVSIGVDNKTIFSNHPIFFADCDPHMTHFTSERSGVEAIPIPWATSNDCDVLDLCVSRLLFMFTDVVCIFADDVGGLEGAKTLLASWASYGSASSLPTRPRVIVVVASKEPSATCGITAGNDFIHDVIQCSGVSDTFASIQMLQSPFPGLSPSAHHRPLKDEVLKGLDIARRDRQEHCALFSSFHLDAFFEKAMIRLCRSRWTAFDFIVASRDGNELGQDYSAHLQDFLLLTQNIPYEVRALLIASSMLMDAYPPRMHAFDPTTVFRTLYREPCLQALRRLFDGVDLEHHISDIERRFIRLHRVLHLGQGPTMHIHSEIMKECSTWLAVVKTNKVCMSCLRRRPQHPLSCHSLCDICVELWGKPVKGIESRYEIQSCVLCQTGQNIQIDLLPRTASVRGIAIDGGGVRGVIPLQMLIQLQNRLGDDCPIQNVFDFACGSSSGGHTAINVFQRRQSPGETMMLFRHLITQIFSRSQSQVSLALSYLCRLVRCGFKDEMYRSSVLDGALEKLCGSTTRMFGAAPVSGVKVAVTTVIAASDAPVLLTNYKHIGRLDADYGYTHHDAETLDEEPLMWQCARATSAAPGFFSMIDLPGIGSCEDGGLRYPNPACLCRSETPQAWQWKPELDVLLSLGTGFGAPSRKMSAGSQRFKDKFPFRLYRFFMSMDGEKAWQALISQLDEETRRHFLRINVLLPGGVPALDGLSEVETMIGSACEQGIGVQGRRALGLLMAASLFFELSYRPRLENGSYHCIGSIRCRISAKTVIRVFSGLYQSAAAKFVLGAVGLGVSLLDEDTCPSCGLYCLPVRFSVKTLDEPLKLAVEVGETRLRLGRHRSARWFCRQQGLDLNFGASNHGMPSRVYCRVCQMKIGRKRALSFPPGTAERRKVRFA
ncbi:hypothetical protein EMCG_07612 [[Emmonsia] crescens]|uniref:PNPLA domain-containing protein n=1 Tax=[Emmonsia] crescens TaxID=73230 RepID=A0A0G2I7U9_9EURO|nr:hypothetical protein EMCG_07612 [Emmonsia crescens UAMH 3008]